jgi:hypothetical protein
MLRHRDHQVVGLAAVPQIDGAYELHVLRRDARPPHRLFALFLELAECLLDQFRVQALPQWCRPAAAAHQQ